ncbi:recombinase family protein [Streptomyces sp. N2-109]|uniref:Recombinase family protein n=1 Tax=Streptomyces gossypii TaxID=2883101 RepID=A0ABT2JSS3_9ACTN|nr:recombinase family protein [Streptomyces gossypii]
MHSPAHEQDRQPGFQPRLPPRRRHPSSPGQLGHSIQDLVSNGSGLRQRGIGFTPLHEVLDTTTPGGRLMFHVFAALTELIRELIVQGTNEGLAASRARLGPPVGHDRRVDLACPTNGCTPCLCSQSGRGRRQFEA